MPSIKGMSARRLPARGYSLVEVLVGVALISILLPGAITAIQWSRIQSRNISLGILAESAAQSLMEMVKRGGYENIAYGGAIPAPIESGEEGGGTSDNPLLDFPRMQAGVLMNSLPRGAAGNAGDAGGYDRDEDGAVPPAILSPEYYLEMSADQIAALNGYRSMSDVPEDTNLLNPHLSWGIYVEVQGMPDEVQGMPDPNAYKLVIIVVKWQNANSGKVRYITSRALVWARDDTRI